ncbi:Uu.00g131280.m01.CDS01 [Anthostomella pinea]|uniref:Uu.00g131280.m01.CDS01 n=1 Tax=Anthostomella pinea TaxID=933095 RepID=A0AAI8VIT7_9PEZI|nr:Uu.00g131280.m01.CDS01 [Anthostomella pinea]
MRFTAIATAASGVGVALSSSILLSGGTIIAFDEEARALDVIRGGSLLVTDDRIAALYETGKPKDLPADTEIVDCTHKIISPGFVDSHRHGWQTAMRTMASNTTLPDYLMRYVGPAAAAIYTAEDVYIGQLVGLLEALNAGVTTTLDHAHHTWTKGHSQAGLDASIDSGARVYWNHNFAGMGDYGIPDQIADFREWVTTRATADSLTTIAAAYDSWTVAPPEDTRAVVDVIKELKIPVLTTHWMGGVWGLDNSPALLHSLDILNTSTAVVFSHAVALDPIAADLLTATNQFISITPESEMHYGHSHFNSHMVQDQAALGIDTHFTFSTDMLTQARMWLQRVRSRLFDEVITRWKVPSNNPMSANQAFLMATRQGALSLRRPDLGVIKVGAKADLVVFDGRTPGMLGWADPVAAVMLHANVGDIVHVIVDGQFKKRGGKLTFEKYDDVVDRFLASAEKLQRLVGEKPAPVLEGKWFGRDAEYGHADEVDVIRGPGTGYGGLFLDTSDKSRHGPEYASVRGDGKDEL